MLHFIGKIIGNFFYKPKKCNCPSCSKLTKSVAGISLLATGLLFSQDCNLTLKGKVVDLHDNTPLAGALINIIGSNENFITNESGFFFIENQCKGIINLKISHISCEDYLTEFDLNKSSSKKFFMEHHIESLDEIIVSENKLKNLSLTANSYSLTETQKDRYSSGNLANALGLISGVSNLSTGNSVAKPVIHGMFGSRVGIIYDGVVLENQQWGQDHAPNVDLNAFDNIRLIKGAGLLKYTGDTPGGVIVLESSTPKISDSLYGKTIVNGMSNGKGLNIISSWTKSFQSGIYFKAQGTIKNNGDYSTPNYVLTNTGNNEKNFNLTVGRNKILKKLKINFSYYSQEIGILRSSHIGNVGDLLRAIQSNEPFVINPFSYQINFPKQFNRHYTSSIEYSVRNNSNRKWITKYNWQKNKRKEYDIRRGSDKYDPALDLTLNTHNLVSNYEWNSSNISYDLGLFSQFQDNYSNPDTGIKRLIPDYVKVRLGTFFTASYSIYDFIDFNFGFRFEHINNLVQKFYRNRRWNDENYEKDLGPYVIRETLSQKLVKRRLIFNNPSINFGVKSGIIPSHEVSLNFFYTQRAPDIAEMFSDGLHHAIASIEYGNPFLKSETTKKVVVNFQKKEGDFQYNLNPYFTTGKNYIVLEPTGVERTIRGAFPVWEYRSISSLLKGIDVDLSYRLNKNIAYKNNTSWIEGVDKNTKTPIINIPPLTTNNQIQFSVSKWKYFFGSITSKYVFSQNQFPNNNFYTSIIDNGSKVSKLVDISTPPDGYHDLGIDLNWGPYDLFSNKISFSLTFDNILNANYRNYLNRMRFYNDELGRNIMIQIKINH